MTAKNQQLFEITTQKGLLKKKKTPDLWDRKHFILLHPKHMKQIDSMYTLIAKSVEKQKKSLGAKKSSHFIGEGFSLYTSKNMRQKVSLAGFSYDISPPANQMYR